jgi:hypothetical protein
VTAEVDETTMRDPFLDWLPPKKIELPVSAPGGGGSASAEPQKKVFDPNAYKVSGEVWGIPKARAIINGKIMGVGDEIEEAKILKIDQKGILMLFDGQEYLLARESIDHQAAKEEKQ